MSCAHARLLKKSLNNYLLIYKITPLEFVAYKGIRTQRQ